MKNQTSTIYNSLKKRIQPVLLVLIICPKILFAQSTEINKERKISFGPRLGVNYSNVIDQSENNYTATGKFGFVGGGFVSFPISSAFSIQPEVLFSQKGFYSSGTIVGINYDFKRTTSFLDIPVFIAWSPTPYLSVLAGPQFSYLLKQTDVVIYPVISNDVEDEFKNDIARKSIASFVAGVDFHLQEFTFGLRGGLDFHENRTGNNTSTPRYKNGWIQVTIGARI